MNAINNAFKRNLSVITGDGSLVKLDVVDPAIEADRIYLAKVWDFEPAEFNAALFIYICNVLDEEGEFKNAVNRKDKIPAVAKAMTEYFTDIYVLSNPKCSVGNYVADHFQVAALSKLEKDMERLYKVWYELTLEEGL